MSRLDTAALKKSFQKLINTSPTLRTNYKIIDGKPVQEVQGYKEVFFEIIDAAALDESSLKKKVKQTNEIPFDLENGDLFKIYLFKVSDEDFVMLISMHHIVSDGWSIGLMFQELKNLYDAETGGNDYAIAPPVKKYSDYIKAQNNFINSDNGNEQWSYWLNELSGELPVLNLPVDKTRPAIQSFKGSSLYFSLEKDLVEQLKKLSQSEGTTLFVTLLTSYQVLLNKYTSQDEIIVGSPTAGRTQSDFERVIGYFISPVAVRGNFSDNPSFKVLLNQIKKKVLGAISNQDFPFALIVERLLKKRDPSRSPVFQTFFGLQKVQQNNEIQEMIVPGNKGVTIKWGKLTFESFEISQQEGQFDITLEFVEGKNLFSGVFKYNTDLFNDDTIQKMVDHFKTLLHSIVDDPERKISELQLLSEPERNIILNEWNGTDFIFDNLNCVHKLIEEQTFKTPDAPAVIFEDEIISYDELNKRSNQLAVYLYKLGVRSGTLVGLCVDRSIEMVVGILGILKAGGAYIPIDTSYPQSRIEFMISDSNTKVFITQKNIAESLPENISNIVLIDAVWEKISKENADNFESETGPDNLAYVIYTSGSTGLPKGVMISHRSLANHMLWMKNVFGFDSSDSVLQKTPFSFDASVWEFYLPLLTGGRLIMAKPEGHMDMAYMVDTIQKNNVTVLQLVPTLLRILLEETGFGNCKTLKTVFCGGEVLTFDLKEKLLEMLNVNFYNLYGPTEATIDATYFKCERDFKNKIIPIGKPIYNTQVYVLDKFLNPVPVGVSGELVIGGVDVAKGYLNNPALSDEKFIDDIFKNTTNTTNTTKGKLYRTGDLAKYSKDGNIEFFGRSDYQVKLRGFRIELGEIESKLLQHRDIKEASVIVREDNPGSQRLAAYIVQKNLVEISVNELKSFLRSSLPEYMVPSVFVTIDALPLLPNGKIDRNALPIPGITKHDEETFTAPRLPVEEILAGIWKDVLGLEKISVHDNFFELGGDSIISIQIISRANQNGIKLTPKQIFQFQTIAGLSGVIDYAAPVTSQQSIVSGEVPLTPIQHWFFEQNLPEPDFYNHSVLLKVPKNLNENFLDESVKEIMKHHDALRLRFKKNNTTWEQINESLTGDNIFDVKDLSGISHENFDDELEKNISEAQRSLNISNGKLMKVRLINTGLYDDDRLLIVIHHLCIDGISWRIILEDLFNSYNQLKSGEKIKLPFKTTSFKDWSNKLVGYESNHEEINYWLTVSGLEPAAVQKDFSPDLNENTVESSDKILIELDESFTQSLLKDVSKTYNTQINDILLSALILAYNNWSDENKLLINLEGHGREELFDSVDVSRTTGWFTSMFPVVLETYNKNDIGDTIKSVKENLRQIPNNGMGFGLIKYLSKDSNVKDKIKALSHPEIIFNYLGQLNENVIPNSDWKLGKKSIILSQNKNGIRNHSIEINSIISDNKLKMEFGFSKNFYRKETIETFAKNYEEALRKIVEHCTDTDAGGYTPSDFDAAGLNQQELDNLLANLN